MKLDADELVTPDFKAEAQRIFESNSAELEGVYFRRRISVLGRALAWGTRVFNTRLRSSYRTVRRRLADMNAIALVSARV